jgi:hypothetical protein
LLPSRRQEVVVIFGNTLRFLATPGRVFTALFATARKTSPRESEIFMIVAALCLEASGSQVAAHPEP